MPGQAMDYSVELGRARCHQLLNEKYLNQCTVQTFTNCWLSTMSPNQDGYIQVHRKKNSVLHLPGRVSQTAFLLHIIAYVANNGNHPLPQASHLCDNRNCFNPDHIMAETAVVNNSRKGCPGPIYCPDHYHLILDACNHTPKCIRMPRQDVSCCLAIKESDPVGWATSSSAISTSRPSSAAEQLVQRSSSEFSGGEFLGAGIQGWGGQLGRGQEHRILEIEMGRSRNFHTIS